MKRSFLLYLLITSVGLTFIARLFHLQVIKGVNYDPTNNPEVKVVFDYPERGFIYDRNAKLLGANQLSYDVMVTPNQVEPLDTLQFCNLLKIDKEDFISRFNRANNYASYLPSVFLKQLAKEDFAYLQEKLHLFKGFYIQKRVIRDYPVKSAANVLGYIGEVNEEVAKNDSYYEPGELQGKKGVEKQYESILRGVKGKKYYSRDRLNKITGSYRNGEMDTLAKAGSDLTLTIDSELQQYGELLMQGKRGGIVAIEPETGEILLLITSPNYDPEMMVGRKRSENSVMLFGDTINKPMFDRGLQAIYAPGSPFKLVNALVGLQENVIDTQTSFYCYKGYKYGNTKKEFMGCHCGIYGQPIQLHRAISKSCNSYFANTYKRIVEKNGDSYLGLTKWSNHLKSFGLGDFLGYDLPEGRRGLIPDGDYYNNKYKFRWSASTNISNAIGQGEVLTTPIQLANLTATIANKGYYYIPHIVKNINNNKINDTTYTTKKITSVNPKHFHAVIEGMGEVFETGTASWTKLKDIKIAGKTGTAENFIKRNGKKIQLPDHSILVAFAPKDNPKIALAVYIENGGYGSTIAAPITSLIIEKYLKGKIERKWIEDLMLKTDLYPIYNQAHLNPEEIETRKN